MYLIHLANSTSQLSISDLRAVVEYLWPARSKWYRIGLFLGIEEGTLETTKKDHRDNSGDCLSALMSTWLKGTDPKPTWRALEDVLKSPPMESS